MSEATERHPFWEPRWYDDQHCCKLTADAELHGWTLGSHYHCPRCWAETGMYGHYTTIHRRGSGQVTVGHQCCPGDCAMEQTR